MTTILHAHPIAADVRERILAELADIERRENVTVLYACESGSRGWGFASPDSDYDVRFLYVHRLDWYLSVEERRDVIERPISDELDVGGWELRKALRLLHRSNPTLLEWLDSPVVYRSDPQATARLRELARICFHPLRGRHHYLSMATKNFREHLQGERVRLKKYLYVLRPLLAARWIDAGLGMPPMRFAELAERLVPDAGERAEINALLELKMAAGEAETGPRRPVLQSLIERELEAAERTTPTVGDADEARDLDRLLLDMVLTHDRRA